MDRTDIPRQFHSGDPLNRVPALLWSMVLSENRYPLFGIML
jgi:hypothetical protein